MIKILKKPHQFSLLTASCAGLLAVAVAQAEPISTDRPDFVDSPDVVGAGHIQIEYGNAWDRNVDQGESVHTWSMPTLLRFGVTDDLELRLETDGPVSDKTSTAAGSVSHHGFADVSLGLKWHALDGDEASNTPALGVEVQSEVDTGSAAFRGQGWRPAVRMLTEWDLGDSSVGVLAGLVYDNSASGRFWARQLAVTLGHQLTENLRFYLEIAGQQLASANNGGNFVTWDSGFTWLLNDALQLDFEVSLGANPSTPNSIGVGISRRF